MCTSNIATCANWKQIFTLLDSYTVFLSQKTWLSWSLSTIKHLLSAKWQVHKAKLSSVKGSELNAYLIHWFFQVPTNRKIRQTCPAQINLPLRMNDASPELRLFCLLSLHSTVFGPHRANLAQVPWSAGRGIAIAKMPHAFKHQWP